MILNLAHTLIKCAAEWIYAFTLCVFGALFLHRKRHMTRIKMNLAFKIMHEFNRLRTCAVALLHKVFALNLNVCEGHFV